MLEHGAPARLPNELTDAVIDHLDFGSLLNAALVARSWRARSRVRLFARLEVWSGSCRTCARSRLPRGLAARMPCSVFGKLWASDNDIFKYVRELHVVFSDARSDAGARTDADRLLGALTLLSSREVEHLRFYSFPDNLTMRMFSSLLSRTTVLSLHLVDFQRVHPAVFIVGLTYMPNIRTIALLGGACLGTDIIQITTFAAQMKARVASYVLPVSSQVFLAPDNLVDLLAWILHAPRVQRSLNVVGLRSFTWSSALDDFVRSHNAAQLEAIMSSVQSFELTIDYEDKMPHLVRMLHAFQGVPTLQITFESCLANIELVLRLLQSTDLDWTHLECLVLTPRLFDSAVPAAWALLDEHLAHAHFVSLSEVVIHLKGAFPAETASRIVGQFTRLQERGMLRVNRRSADDTQNLFLPFIAGQC